MIGSTYLEDQNLGHHRELKDGGTLVAPTLVRAGELVVQAHTFDRCGVEEPLLDGVEHISTIDARRVSVMVNSIPSVVILCTRDRGSIASSIEMRGRERARR
jgi:hypothetical protein